MSVETELLVDVFNGDNEKLIASIKASIELSAAGALVPHGLSNNSRDMLAAAACRLRAVAQCTLASNATTISCSGKDITIACDDHDTKQAVMDALTGDRESGVDLDCVAKSLASMLTEYVEGGIRSNQNWRNGLNEIILARLRRLIASPAPLADEAGMREAVERAVCCPEGVCAREIDGLDCWRGREPHERKQADAICAALRPSQAAPIPPHDPSGVISDPLSSGDSKMQGRLPRGEEFVPDKRGHTTYGGVE